MKILLTLSYFGKNFCGYQAQIDKRTVQTELNRACHELFGFDCDVTGCSRTDSGVHANMFCATVTQKGTDSLKIALSVDRVPLALNAHLPDDIAVISAREVDGDFHPRYDVKYKEYVYRIYNSPTRSPFEDGRSWHIPQQFSEADIENMNVAAQAFIGQHDFKSFMAQGAKVESTVRNVKYADVARNGDVILFRVAADGFLYNMVRIMTGTLISVGKGKIKADSIPHIISSLDRNLAGPTAPPHGLYLNKVIY